MNRKRREHLKEAMELLDKAYDIVSIAQEDEQYSLDNLPENLQDGDRASAMEEAVDNLEDALQSIEDAKSKIDDASL